MAAAEIDLDVWAHSRAQADEMEPDTTHDDEWERCRRSAAYFINTHVIIDEPQGEEFAEVKFELWPEQLRVLLELVTNRLSIILKARQLGITWLCCAYALWLCLFRPGRIVLLFSKGQLEAVELTRRIKVMYQRLPESLRRQRKLTRDKTEEIGWDNGSKVRSLAATKSAGRTFTASLVLMDEAAFMQWGAEVYTSLKPTIDGGGQLIVLSTANGETGFFHKLWTDAVKTLNNFKTIFLSWRARPGRDAIWRARVAAEALSAQTDLQEYPDTPEEAFQSTGAERFLESMQWWDECLDEDLPTLDKNTPLALAADAGWANDSFGLVGFSWHPKRDDVLALQIAREWIPKKNHPLNFDTIEDEIRKLCGAWNVKHLAYDPTQLHQMMGRLKGVVPTQEFSQGAERATGDKHLFDIIFQRKLAHRGDREANMVRKHIDNADRKLTDDRKLRIVKREYKLKIDLAVSASMSALRASKLPKRPIQIPPTRTSSIFR